MNLNEFARSIFGQKSGPSEAIAEVNNSVPNYTPMNLGGGVVMYVRDGNSEEAWFSIINKSCIDFKARTLGTLPGHVYKREGDKRIQVAHPLDAYLNGRWNQVMTAVQGRMWQIARVAACGNAYVRVVYRGGRPVEFYPIENCTPIFEKATGKIKYRVMADKFNDACTLLDFEVIHLKSSVLSDDGLTGRSPVTDAAAAVNMSVSIEEFYNRVIIQGQHAPGTVSRPTGVQVNERDLQIMQDSFAAVSGVNNAGKVRILPPGFEYKPGSMTMIETDLTAQQKWILKQITRAHGINAYLIGEMDEMKYSNGYEAVMNFVKFTGAPEVIMHESSLIPVLDNMGQLGKGYYVKFNLDALLRADPKTRAETYKMYRDMGVYSPNDVMRREDEVPFDGGDYRNFPLNMAMIDGGEIIVPSKNPFKALNVLLDDAKLHIKQRIESDGDTDRNRSFAIEKLKTLSCAFAMVGLDFNSDQIYDELVKESDNAPEK